jgi:probable F420-dependent oxidoreductase
VNLGCYLLAGQPESSRDLIEEVRKAEELQLDAAFISERYNKKEAAVLSGAAGAVSERIRIITAATNHNTRHPAVTAGFARTMQSLTGGRFTLGLGRGVVAMQDAYGIPRITTQQIEDFALLMRRLFRGEAVFDWPGSPVLHLDSSLDEHLPMCLTAFGDRTLELAGRVFDDVVLHTYFTDEVTKHSVEVAKNAAADAGKEIRVWSCFATIPDHLPEETRLKKSVGRLGTYLQGYGELLVRTNGWDPQVLRAFLDDDVIKGVAGLDIVGTTEQLAHAKTLIPDEWFAASASGTPEQCADKVRGQYALGCDGVILHGCTPTELEPVIRELRKDT